MHADDGGVDHLDSSIMRGRKCIYDAAPHASPSPAYEPVVAGGVWAKRRRQIPPRRPGPQDPKDALRIRRSFTRGTPRGLLGSIGLIVVHS
jgi:hypothetical protein